MPTTQDKYINQLSDGNPLQGPEFMIMEQFGESLKTSPNAILAFILSRINTDDIPEGIANLYFTNTRADSRVNIHANRTDNPHNVTATQLGLGNVLNIKCNFTATSDPGVGDDAADGYSVGSLWVNLTTDKVWACTDPTNGAAVWRDLTNISITKSSIGLGNVENTALSTWAGSNNITTVNESAVTAHTEAIDHNLLLNYSNPEHVDHSNILINPVNDGGLGGGGFIDDDVDLKIDFSNLTDTFFSSGLDPDNDAFAYYNYADAESYRITLNDMFQLGDFSKGAFRNTVITGSVDGNGVPNAIQPLTTGRGWAITAASDNPFSIVLANGVGSSGASDIGYTLSSQYNVTSFLPKFTTSYLGITSSGGSFSPTTAIPILPVEGTAWTGANNRRLMHFTGTNGATGTGNILDDFGNTLTTATATLSTTQTKFGSTSCSFVAASSQRLQQTSVTAPGSKWEFDFWFRPNSVSGTYQLFNWTNSTNFGINVTQVNNTVVVNLSSNGTTNDIGNLTSYGCLAANTWYHVVVTQPGNFFQLVINGVLEGELYSSTAITSAATTMTWGSTAAGGTYFDGYMDEFRLINGAVNYGSGGFTVPISAYSALGYWFDTNLMSMKLGAPGIGWNAFPIAVIGSANTTEYWNSLCNFNTSNANGELVNDECGNAKWFTTSTFPAFSATAKFGANSLEFASASSSYAGCFAYPIQANKPFDIDFQVRFKTVSGTQTIFTLTNNTGYGLNLTLDASGNLLVYYSSNGTTWAINGATATSGLTTNTWYHIRAAYDGTTFRIYRDGTSVYSSAQGSGINPTTGSPMIYLGSTRAATQFLNGFIDSLAVRYGYTMIDSTNTTSFTAPTSAYNVSQLRTVDSTTTFAYRGEATVSQSPLTGLNGVNTSKTHNLGTRLYDMRMELECLTTDAGYAVGDIIRPDLVGSATTAFGISLINSSITQCSFTLGSATTLGAVPNKTTGALTSLVLANWALRIYLKRRY